LLPHLLPLPLLSPPPPPPTLFPYTTLFRSPHFHEPIQPKREVRSPAAAFDTNHLRETPVCDPAPLPLRATLDRIARRAFVANPRSEEHTSELQSRFDLVCRLLLEKKNKKLQ